MLRGEVRMEIMVLQRQGLSRRKIAARLGIHWETVRRCLARGGEPPAGFRGRRGSRLGEFAERMSRGTKNSLFVVSEPLFYRVSGSSPSCFGQQ
jgi:IS30 family transposase